MGQSQGGGAGGRSGVIETEPEHCQTCGRVCEERLHLVPVQRLEVGGQVGARVQHLGGGGGGGGHLGR